MDHKTDVAVIGGGAIGLFTALYLSRAGRRVMVFDRGDPGSASDGNAGMITPSHIIPMAAPGVVKRGLIWLTSAESPFYVKPRLDPALARWLWRFRAACTDEHVGRSVPVLRDLTVRSVALYDELARIEGMEAMAFARTGLLMLHRTEHGRDEDLAMADRAEAAGLDIERLDRSAVLELDPNIRSPFTGGVLYRDDGRIDPNGMMEALAGLLERSGVTIHRREAVEGFESKRGAITCLRTTGGAVEADEVVLAAGAWSGRLAHELGIELPVQPATGYSITCRARDATPRMPHILTDDWLTVTPMPGRVRFAGTLTLVGFDGSINPRRVSPLRRLVETYYSASPQPEMWHGYRPCSPDGLPFIGRAGRFENLTVATGHGMLGITLGPITGKLVAEIIDGERTSCDLAACAPARFSKSRTRRLRFSSRAAANYTR